MGLKKPEKPNFFDSLLGVEEKFGKPQIPPKNHGTQSLMEVQADV
jgi:hypothetical protein